MLLRSLAAIAATMAIAGCSTFTTPRYSIAPDTNVALKAINTSGVSVGAFTGPATFDASCRGAGPLATVDGISHSEYLRKALEAELKVAGIHTDQTPRVVLSGQVTKLEFSSTRAITGGSWDIQMLLKSSNGMSLTAAETYLFQSGFVADTACKQTAEAYLPAVQNLIAKTVRTAEFKSLLQ